MLSILIALIVGLLGLVRYQSVKKGSAEAILANVDMKEKLASEDEKAAEAKAQLVDEELKRKTVLASQRTDNAPGTASVSDLTNFLNEKEEK